MLTGYAAGFIPIADSYGVTNCDPLLSHTPVADVRREFGSLGDLGVDVGLPHVTA